MATDSATIRLGTSGTQTRTFIAGIEGVTLTDPAEPVVIDANGQLGTMPAASLSSPWSESGSDIFFNDGNVGIGTATPNADFHIYDGFARFTATSVSNVLANFELDTGSGIAPMGTISGGGGNTLVLRGASHLALASLQGEALRVNFDRNIGIGTTAPTEKLHVVGNILATGSITPGSSREFKKNIAPLSESEAFEAFAALDPVKFNYKADESGDLQLGFIAEDVPDLVSIPSKKGIAPMDLIAVLTKVVQQQQEVISALQSQVDMLASRIE